MPWFELKVEWRSIRDGILSWRPERLSPILSWSLLPFCDLQKIIIKQFHVFHVNIWLIKVKIVFERFWAMFGCHAMLIMNYNESCWADDNDESLVMTIFRCDKANSKRCLRRWKRFYSAQYLEIRMKSPFSATCFDHCGNLNTS